MISVYTPPTLLLTQSLPLPTHISLEALTGSFPKSLWTALPTLPDSLSTELTQSSLREVVYGTANSAIQQFHSTKKARKPIKLENVRSSLIRCWKKSMRVLKAGTVSFVGVKKFPRTISPAIAKEYISKVNDHFEICWKLARTQEGPGIDSKHSHSSHKTYNNDCLKELFDSSVQRELWQAYVRVIFSDSDPNSLSERFEFTCCKRKSHSKGCSEKWEQLRRVLVDYLGCMEVRI